MLSRVAESIFWMARYMERTNRMLRMLHTKYISSQDEITDFSWNSVLKTYSDKPEEEFVLFEKDSSKVLEHLVTDRDNSFSVINNIIRARENARSVQDHITKEVWQCLNEYFHVIRDPSIEFNIQKGDPVTSLEILIRQGMLYNGTVDVTMAREEGFNFLNIGRFLSRAVITTDLLNIKLTEYNYDLKKHAEDPTWRFLLYSLSGYELYLKTNRGNLYAKLVIEHVLYNTDFPHSLLYSLTRLKRYFERLKDKSTPESYSQLEFRIGRCFNNIKYSNIAGNSELLKKFLQEIRGELFDIANLFNKLYFGNT
ncbi:MAG TPA: alpha-E domain-containing protein [Chitinophagaceae bacterium]|nr:alpha-E domain-containing protein [Chitinophagaceae bacterium]MCB9054557.1 alpha-E domain-containing protein [Chitinophagales bacterium]HRX92522.1 alpha-E domain-containing protein [Chitinophagaceae bacterium]